MLTDRVEQVDLQTEMQRSYLDYAMSVIVGRALPDVRDGLKPVHRRVIYAMFDGGYRPDRSFSKCARVIGEVMGQYHPHGDTADLRRARPPGPAVVPALPAGARPGQLRLARQRRRRRPAVHRDQDGAARHGDGPGHRRGNRRLPGQLRRPEPGADHPAGAVPEPAGQRLGRHRGRHGHQHPAAQPARGRRRRPVVPREPDRHPRGTARSAHPAHQGTRLPDRRADPRPQGHPGRLPHRPRLDHDARGRQRRGAPGPHLPGGHRAAVPGQPRQPRDQDRRPRQGRQDRRHRRHPRRDLGPHRPAPGDRAQARRRRQGRAEQPLQAHPAAGELRRQHAGDRRRRAAHAAASTRSSALDRPPDRGHRPPHAVPPAQGRGAKRTSCAASSRRSTRSTRSSRSSGASNTDRGRPRRPDGAAGDRRAAGRRDPRHAAAPARRPRAPEDP